MSPSSACRELRDLNDCRACERAYRLPELAAMDPKPWNDGLGRPFQQSSLSLARMSGALHLGTALANSDRSGEVSRCLVLTCVLMPNVSASLRVLSRCSDNCAALN